MTKDCWGAHPFFVCSHCSRKGEHRDMLFQEIKNRAVDAKFIYGGECPNCHSTNFYRADDKNKCPIVLHSRDPMGGRMIQTDGLHLTGENIEELHNFAKAIGMKKSWFQNHPKHPHYDLLSENMLNKALEHGAVLTVAKDQAYKNLEAGIRLWKVKQIDKKKRRKPMGKKREFIKSAAILCSDDKIIEGRDHAQCISKAKKGTCKAGSIQGFVTSDERFVGRVIAGEIAYKAGQLLSDPEGNIILSEEIWSDGPWNWDEEKQTYYLPRETRRKKTTKAKPKDVRGLWRNIKTGDQYLVTAVAICATNSLDGTFDVVYSNISGDVFTRELHEFMAKFEMVEVLNPKGI